MKKYCILLISILILLNCILSVPAFAAVQVSTDTGGINKSSSVNFNWVGDYSHLSYDYKSIAFGKGVFVAVGQNGVISVSKDLKSWTDSLVQNNVPDDFKQKEFKTVLFNGDVFVAAGGNDIYYSKDGYRWSNVKIQTSGNEPGEFVISVGQSINSGITDGKSFVLSGGGVLAYSDDGINWINYPGIHYEDILQDGVEWKFSNVIYNGFRFIAICSQAGGDSKYKYSVYTSEDGHSWNTAEFNVPDSHPIDLLSLCGNKYYISSYESKSGKYITYESDDLSVWKSSSIVLESIFYHFDDTTYKLGNGIYHYKNVKEFTTAYKSASSEKLYGICKGNGKIVAVGTNGLILFSNVSDKKNAWTAARSQCFKDIYSAAAGKDFIIAVGKDGQIIKSKDGHNWSLIHTSITKTLHSVLYDGKNFVAVGDNGTIATSTNGDSWTLLPQKTKIDLISVKKLNGKYIATGKGAVILASNDIKNWNLVYDAQEDPVTWDEKFSGVTWKDGVYYAVSYSSSKVYTSKDALSWKQASQLEGHAYTDLGYYKGRFVLTGSCMGISQDMTTSIVTKQDSYPWDFEGYAKISSFKDFLLTGTPDGNILFSPDGILWNNAGNIGTYNCVYSFVEFKGSYYGFANNGLIINGVKKSPTASASDITVSPLKIDPNLNMPGFTALKSQPMMKNNVMMLTCDTIGKIIGSTCSYDEKKKTAQISLGKKNLQFTLGSSYASVNGIRTEIPMTIEVSGSSVYVPAKFTLNALGYSFSYDSFMRRIFYTTDDTVKDTSLSFQPVNFENSDGNQYFNSISYNKKIFVAVAAGGVICTSEDGVNWSKTASVDGEFSKVLWNGSRFILVGGTINNLYEASSLIYVSEDGLKWRKIEGIPSGKFLCQGTVGSSSDISEGTYTGDTLKQTVLVTADGMILTSEDGLIWKKTHEAGLSNYYYVSWYKGKYYASCRDTGNVFISDDGLHWGAFKSELPISKFFISGGSFWGIYQYKQNNTYSSKIYNSTNGETWNLVNDLPTKYVDGIIYTGSNYILLGSRSFWIPPENCLYAMVSKSGDLWDYSNMPESFDYCGDILLYKDSVIVATNKGLFTLTVK